MSVPGDLSGIDAQNLAGDKRRRSEVEDPVDDAAFGRIRSPGRQLLATPAAAGGDLFGPLRGVDPVPQRLVVHAKLSTDLTQRPMRRRANQLDRIRTELLGVLRWTGHYRAMLVARDAEIAAIEADLAR